MTSIEGRNGASAAQQGLTVAAVHATIYDLVNLINHPTR